MAKHRVMLQNPEVCSVEQHVSRESRLPMSDIASPKPTPSRLTSLDQFRGYTMFGMLLVNFLGGYQICPRILRHTHDYCSYADTIMPQFLFAAGFAMRLSLGSRWEREGHLPWSRAVRRILGLALVAVVWYTVGDFGSIVKLFQNEDPLVVLGTLMKRNWCQTLMHIALTSLWILPVIVASTQTRLIYMTASAVAHIGLSWWFNFQWVNGANGAPSGIDGGPLGFLTWCVPAILGTIACDLTRRSGVAASLHIMGRGAAVMLLGWLMTLPTVLYNVPAEQQEALKDQKLADDPVLPELIRLKQGKGEIVEPPFVPPPGSRERKWNYWMMSQRAGSLSYITFSAGVSLVLFALFLWACDGHGWQLGFFRTLGTNSLAAYILHDIAGWIVGPFLTKTSSAGVTLLGFACFTLLVYGACRLLEWKKWYLRI